MVYFVLSVFISYLDRAPKYLTRDLRTCTYILKYYQISLNSAKQKNGHFLSLIKLLILLLDAAIVIQLQRPRANKSGNNLKSPNLTGLDKWIT
jgi:hypothetical protein